MNLPKRDNTVENVVRETVKACASNAIHIYLSNIAQYTAAERVSQGKGHRSKFRARKFLPPAFSANDEATPSAAETPFFVKSPKPSSRVAAACIRAFA
jgi:hypothetical protein